MMKNNAIKEPNLSKDRAIIFVFFLALSLGVIVRLSQVIKSAAPINDGGLFFQMAIDLQKNNYHLPVYSSYNNLDIPFVYPPFSFYFISLISDISQVDLFDLFRILPALISILSIPAFYLIFKEIHKTRPQLALSLVIFSLIPSAFDWLIMGGGLTRAFGFFFSLLTIQQSIRLFRAQNRWGLIGTSVFGTLTVLSHPEAILQTLAGVFVVFMFFGWNRRAFLQSLIVSISVILLSSPWWLTVVFRHGIEPFTAASGTGWHSISSIIQIWQFNFTGEIGLTLSGVLALIGLFVCLAKRDYFFPAWLFVTFVIDPRSAPIYISPILAILAAQSLELLIIRINNFEAARGRKLNKSHTNWAESLLSGRVTKILLLILLTQWLYSAFIVPVYRIQSMSLTQDDLNAFSWINENIPQGSTFAIITGLKPLTDPVNEWFPALTKSISVSTPQGHEWIPETDFTNVLQQSLDLQACFDQMDQCVEDWELVTGKSADFIFIRRNSIAENSVLDFSLQLSPPYIQSYISETISIFQNQR